MNIEVHKITLEPFDNIRLLSLCGPCDNNIKQVERYLNIKINLFKNTFQIYGNTISVRIAANILRNLYMLTAPVHGDIPHIIPEQIHLVIKETCALEQVDNDSTESIQSISLITKSGIIKPRTCNQKKYINNILNYDITFGIGPAGTGKTYLAVAVAVNMLEKKEISRIVITRPAVEAGEKLGFLPGDLSQKINPYLRPVYDALFDMIGFERVEKLIMQHMIEVAPLAYMRGRTLNDAFIILDESQNTTIEQMKMFLTRIGFNSKTVITGDITQVDLPRNLKSGLNHAVDVLFDIKGISFNYFNSNDVVRHPIVARIIVAYEKWGEKNKK